MSIKDITVVITSFKSENKIRSCLKSIDSNCSVINVENSNNKEYKTKIESDFSNVKCILSGENIGYGKGNNIALNKIKSKYALILNPDAELLADSINNFLKIAELNPDFSMIIPSTVDNKKNLKSYDLVSQNNMFNHLIDIDKKTLKTVRGHAIFLNISKFKDIGFFDENIFFFF